MEAGQLTLWSCRWWWSGGVQVGPYVSKQCGEEYEGPDFIFKLQHTPLPDFLGM